MYGSLMQDPADKARMDRQMLESTLAMMPMAGMTTYHGSPHIFNKFRMDKIGTGEGAQAYGHGLYLAENPNVARQYSNPENSYARFSGHLNNREEFIKDMMDQGRSRDDVWNMTREKYGEFIDPKTLKQEFDEAMDLEFWKHNLYKVDLPDEQIKKMLDWDTPFDKQPEKIKNIFKNTSGGYRSEGSNDYMFEKWVKSPRGSIDLMRGGVPGIKYLDQGSRGAGQGTRNFVVFDENIPQILERNQQPIGGLLGK
jgi:hypothetical protein